MRWTSCVSLKWRCGGVAAQAEMCSDSFQLLGMAERGFLPAVLARRSRHGTPTLAIVLSSIGVLGLVSFDFLQAGRRLPPPLQTPLLLPARPAAEGKCHVPEMELVTKYLCLLQSMRVGDARPCR